ncbi:MAG: undecaprenyldiphospho-muramoylpentapeptide beta-N-acetylglucosaminyltransferase [Acidobacteria bacterium]|nr:undecaprenyldiphospho-muramoylpentapeptide beta-N-acetylglucosaminyltransferase [Acidobacteriota bacterium]
MNVTAGKTFVVVAGGTGGHVLPGLAVARELRQRGHSVVFVGTSRGMESKLVPREGFELRLLEAGALKNVSWRERLRTAMALPVGFLGAARILGQTKPRAVFSMGGYASGPVTAMVLVKNIPLVVMEPNAVPGLAHRLIGRFVTHALLGFEQAGRFFPQGRWEVTGIPIREEFFHVPARRERRPFTVLITGGSQGSHRLNMAAMESLPLWAESEALDRVLFLHQSGENEYNDVCSRYRQFGAQAEVAPYWEDMPGLFARADVVVCRAGASTVAELSAAGRASILVPYPYAADQHQLRNAQALEAAGAARVVEDCSFTGQRLFQELRALERAPERLTEMEMAARRLARPGAARRAAEVLEHLP